MAVKPGPPVWELAIIAVALVLIIAVFILWWFFGYRYVFVEQPAVVMNTIETTTTLLTL
ncbi:MAG: hypothetical protein PHG85_01220 [Candidatus Altiarchaeota archaeon]|nr:hypothetical protein [Candidatus Altiarchaeota archaeon]